MFSLEVNPALYANFAFRCGFTAVRALKPHLQDKIRI